MVVFERYIPWMIYAKDRDLREFYFTVPNKPGQLKKALEVFAKYNINILNISAHAMPEWDRAPIFTFVDFTDTDASVEEVKRELEQTTQGEVYVKTSPVRGFMMDEFAFPLYAFPGVRSIVMLELDFQEMIKGLYEKLGKNAAVFLYYLAYSGGKFIGEYLSEKLGLKGRELLIEILKTYQAGGWGRVELLTYDPDELKITLRLHDSIECRIFEGSKECTSHFIRGHLSGLLSGLLGVNVRFMESKCIAKGDPYCEFYLEKV